MLACWRGRTRCVKTLLELGADPAMNDGLDGSPLIIAAWAGYVGAPRGGRASGFMLS